MITTRELRQLALAATKGGREVYKYGIQTAYGHSKSIVSWDSAAWATEADKEFIETVTPELILRLLDKEDNAPFCMECRHFDRELGRSHAKWCTKGREVDALL